jgi:hypothetical protein
VVAIIAVLCGDLTLAATPLDGQGITTAFAAEAAIRRARFLIQGLEVGGPYVAEVRAIGYVPQRSGEFLLRLGEPAQIRCG